jgi:hypothetical protein
VACHLIEVFSQPQRGSRLVADQLLCRRDARRVARRQHAISAAVRMNNINLSASALVL